MSATYTFDNAGIPTTIVVEAVEPDDEMAGWMCSAKGGAYAAYVNGVLNTYGFGPANEAAARGVADMLRSFRNADAIDVDSLPLD